MTADVEAQELPFPVDLFIRIHVFEIRIDDGAFHLVPAEERHLSALPVALRSGDITHDLRECGEELRAVVAEAVHRTAADEAFARAAIEAFAFDPL